MFFEKEYAVGRVRAMRAKLLRENTMAEIRSAKSVSDIMLLLGGTHYEHAFSKRNLEYNERALSGRFAITMRRVFEFIPKEYYDCLLPFYLEADAKNIKTCMEGFFGGMHWDMIRQDMLECGIVFEKIKNQEIPDFGALCSSMDGCLWHEPMKKCMAYFEEKNIPLAEHEIDKTVFIHAEESKSGSVRSFFLEKKELCDFRIMLLSEDLGMPAPAELLFMPWMQEHITKKYAHLRGGSLEKNIRNHLLSLSRRLMLLEPFSFGLFIDFFCRTENEPHAIAGSARHISSKVPVEAEGI